MRRGTPGKMCSSAPGRPIAIGICAMEAWRDQVSWRAAARLNCTCRNLYRAGCSLFNLPATLLPAANALELSVSSSVELEVPKSSLIVEPGTTEFLSVEDDLTATASGAIFSTQLALVSAVSRQVELARTPIGAKKVARGILMDEYGFEEKEYKCLNQLWTQESNWNYKSRNKKSGAHGIPQALPASKMNVVSTDWRTNPVTQIRWGLRYISIRYETPCKAWAKHKRSNWY